MKKLLSLILSLLLISSFSYDVLGAVPNNSTLALEALLSKRSLLIAEGRYDELAEIEVQIESLEDVEVLTSSEVFRQHGNDAAIQPFVSTPSSNNVTWYSIRTDVTHSGVTYEMQSLYAQAKNSSSNLTFSTGILTRNVSFNQAVSAGTLNLTKIIAGNALSSIKGVNLALTLYDIAQGYNSAFSAASKVERVNGSYLYSGDVTVCFQYMKVKGEPDSNQYLSHISTKYDLAFTVTLAEFVTTSGNYEHYSYSDSYTSQPANYASISMAVLGYLGTTRYTYDDSIVVYGPNNTYLTTIGLITPSAPTHVQ